MVEYSDMGSLGSLALLLQEAIRCIMATTTLKYSKLGWGWTTAYSAISLTDAVIPLDGGIGRYGHAAKVYFADFRYYPRGTFNIAPVRLASIKGIAISGIAKIKGIPIGELRSRKGINLV